MQNWNGTERNGTERNGMQCNEMEWNGTHTQTSIIITKRNGTEWTGLEWNETELNERTERNAMMKFYWGCATSSVGIFKTLHKLRKLHHRLLILSKKMLVGNRVAYQNTPCILKFWSWNFTKRWQHNEVKPKRHDFFFMLPFGGKNILGHLKFFTNKIIFIINFAIEVGFI
jgi:hypothetical protein